MKNRMPKLFIQRGREVKELRQKMGRNQLEFWGPIGVTQSGGSRYESGRDSRSRCRCCCTWRMHPRSRRGR